MTKPSAGRAIVHTAPWVSAFYNTIPPPARDGIRLAGLAYPRGRGIAHAVNLRISPSGKRDQVRRNLRNLRPKLRVATAPRSARRFASDRNLDPRAVRHMSWECDRRKMPFGWTLARWHPGAPQPEEEIRWCCFPRARSRGVVVLWSRGGDTYRTIKRMTIVFPAAPLPCAPSRA